MSLVIENVSKVFDNSNDNIIKNISLEIMTGEFICIVGMSGCGKSTLLNIIAGLEKPTEGRIVLDDVVIDKPGMDRAMVFQEHGLFPWLSVIENVKFGMSLQGMTKKEQEEKAMYFLKMVHLDNYRDYSIHQISGGMKQRVALARALAVDAKVLLMDEPFSALDKQTSNTLREELQRIWMETHKTIIFITHSVEEAIFLADRVVVLSKNIAGISNIIPIELERPRHVYDNKFVEYRHRILDEVRRGED